MVKGEFENTSAVKRFAAVSVLMPMCCFSLSLLLRVCLLHSPSPTERFSYVALGNDWPSAMPNREPKAVASAEQKRRYNPIRRAWRRRTLLRIFARRS
jgi:hypothetical protein